MGKPKENGHLSADSGEDVVISGIAGRFPGSDNVKEFAENLYNKKLLTTTKHTRYDASQSNIPPALGVINNIEKFDALFFGVSSKQAYLMDPMSRMLLEHTFEAVLDAGINPNSLSGRNAGVFVGCCINHIEPLKRDERNKGTGLGVIGRSRAMLANRLSFYLDVHGPSLTVDTACSSTLTALELASKAIKSGECDTAVVGGCNMCCEPLITRMFHDLGALTMEEESRCFDADASGYVRSETVGVLVLQKAKNAKRIYSTVVHVKSNVDGYKPQGITYPSLEKQVDLFRQTHKECGVSPTDVSFIEAHVTATRVGDLVELQAIDEFYLPGRTTTLKIGSVKSNMGHSEAASAIGSIAKVLFTMETGLIPPNVNYNKPREEVESLEKGRLQVVTETTPWEGGYIVIDSSGFGGTNVHLILKPNPKQKRAIPPEKDELPKLVFASGRTQEAVETFLNDVENRPVDAEYIRLLHDIFAEDIRGHMYRGYTIVNLTTGENAMREIEKQEGGVRPVWFIFSGMGSQWPGMGISLMRFPVFARAVQKCHAVLKPRGVDVIDIITNTDEHNFDNVLRSFVGITTIQIGLVDLLKSVGIVPDKVMGHSFGELGCAYADGCFTAKETILAAYSRGLASIEAELVRGSMAVVAIGYKQIKDSCPKDVGVACHNGPTNSTITGPAESVRKFIAQLQAKGIFAREISCGNIAYHSRYIAPAAQKFLAYLRDFIKEPKERSEKWLSTSVPRAEWLTPKCKLSSAEYHINNFMSPVLFEETAELIPKNAIAIEIAPYGLLQRILKQSLDPTVLNVALTIRGHKDNTQVVLQALGKLYNAGLQPQAAKLYPEIEFPVSRGTPMISPLVKWDHSEDFDLPGTYAQTTDTVVKTHNINISNELGKSMVGHVIDGRHLVPATAYLSLVWDTCSAEQGTKVSVLFENVMFHRATIIPEEGNIQLTVTIEKSTEKFHITESNVAIVTGTVRILKNPSHERIPTDFLTEIDEPEQMDTTDVYKEFKLRGSNYFGEFCGIKSFSVKGNKGHVVYNNNWIPFLETIFQIDILRHQTRELCIPTGIKKMIIDVTKHEEELQMSSATDKSIPVTFYDDLQTAVCGGVEVRGISLTFIPRHRTTKMPIIEDYKFIAHRDLNEITLFESTSLFVHVAFENIQSLNMRCLEFIDDRDDITINDLVSPIVTEALGNTPLARGTALLVTKSNRFDGTCLPASITITEASAMPRDSNIMIAFGHDLLSSDRVKNLKLLTQIVQSGGFVVSTETEEYSAEYAQSYGVDIIMEKRVNQKKMLLLKKRIDSPNYVMTIHLNNEEFSWLDEVKAALNAITEGSFTKKSRLVLVGEGFENGLLGFLICVRKEPGGEMIRGVLIQDENAPKFSLDNPFYRKQLELDLAMNVLRGNVWGTYRHLPLPPVKPKLFPHAVLKQKDCGDLRSFCWVEGPIKDPTSDKKLVRTYYCALNFRDVMTTTGKLQNSISCIKPDEDFGAIGYEFSGVDADGKRVMGLSCGGGFQSICEKDQNFTFPVPDDWSLKDAATVLCAYATCYYAFYVAGRIKKGYKVLIHAGSGAVGQAAINLALHEGCEVFTTVGTAEKRRFIKETVPTIDDDHIGNSRDSSFELMVLRQTKGQGVDVVLNSLAGGLLQASVRCLAGDGQFLEIGKFDIDSNSSLGMGVFSKCISFKSILLDRIMLSPTEETQIVAKLISDGLKKGVIKPLVSTVFQRNQVEEAFRYMAAGKHIGKVLIKLRDEENSLDKTFLAHPRYYCKKNGSYLIFGGLGDIGSELVDWLIVRGARNFVLVSRTGIKSGFQRMKLKNWESRGVKLLVVVGKDVSSAKDVGSILRTAEELGPIDGIFNLAGVLCDAMCISQTAESFKESFKGKAWLTKILDKLSRKMCPHLRHFVVFSSSCSGKGNVGQTNYGMTNNVMDRICEKRVQDGLPGLAIQWGLVRVMGITAHLQVKDKDFVIAGYAQQPLTSCFEELDGFLQRSCPIVSSTLLTDKSEEQRSKSVVEVVQSIMGLKDIERINMSTPLPELGMDSITAMEIKETLECEFDIFLALHQIRTLNFAKLLDMSKDTADPNTAEKDTSSQNVSLADKKYIGNIVGTDEMYSEVCIQLPTKAEPHRRRIFMIPGMEGCGVAFSRLVEHIKHPATCIQIDLNCDKKCHESVEETANLYLPYILSPDDRSRSFTIVGYSFGGLMSIELARKLEAKGLSVQLILIDCVLEHLKFLRMGMMTNDEEEGQNRFLTVTLENFAPARNVPLKAALKNCTTWEEKLEKAIDCFESANAGTKIFGETYKKLFDAMYRRSIAIKTYNIDNKRPIKSPVTFLKASEDPLNTVEGDYGLHKITEGPIKVHHLEGDHITLMDNLKIARMINGDAVEDLMKP